MHHISERLQLLAADLPRGWQADLARHCGVRAPSVNGWLHGITKRMDAEHLFNAADFFKVNPRWLAFGVGPRDLEDDQTAPEERLVPQPPDLEALLHSLGTALLAHNRQTRETAGVMLENFARNPEHSGNILQAIVTLLDHPNPSQRGQDNYTPPPRRPKYPPEKPPVKDPASEPAPE